MITFSSYKSQYRALFSSNFLNFFVGLSLVAVFILPTYVYFFVSPDFRQLVVDNSITEAKRVSSHLASSFRLNEQGEARKSIYQTLLSNESSIKDDFQIEEFKFFDSSGLILYSSDHAEIGKVNENLYFKEIVAKGSAYTKVVEKGSKTLEGRVVPVSVVETYVPMLSNGTFVGAFEIYYDITEVKNRLEKLMSKVYSVLTMIGGAIVLLTGFSFYKTRKDLAEKKLQDEEKERNFQTEVIFNKLFQLSLAKTSLEEILENFLFLITSLPWIEVEPKGAFFLVVENPHILEMKAERGLGKEVLAACSQVPFGKCICGRTAASGEWFFPDNSCDKVHDVQYPGMLPHGHYCVPIHASGGKLIGVFTLYTKENMVRHPLSEKLFLGAANLIAGIIERKQLEEKLHNNSITDELTGLFNRRGFRTLAQQELELARRKKMEMAVFYLDLDGLKLINDNQGHNAGDLAIMDTAEILRETFRSADIIARIGGDEFAVFGTFSPEEGSVSSMTSRLREQIQSFNEKSGRPFTISCSVGVAHVIADDGVRTDLDEILLLADRAMYSEKLRKNPG